MAIKDFEPRVLIRCQFCSAQDVCMSVPWLAQARRALEQQSIDPKKRSRKVLNVRSVLSCGGLVAAEAKPDNDNTLQTKPGA